LEVGAEGGFKLDLRQDRDSGKQKLKGAVRTETYWRDYCQQEVQEKHPSGYLLAGSLPESRHLVLFKVELKPGVAK
jgi:hypothetical protein